MITVDASSAKITRELHAAHTLNGGGWDLEWIEITTPDRASVVNLPPGFKSHVGNRDSNGTQHWFFVREAPMSLGKCGRCPKD